MNPVKAEISRLTVERMKQGITQRVLAKKLDISASLLSRIEHRTKMATKEEAQIIAGIFGGSPSYFFDEKGFAILMDWR